jgi:anti-sigma B factor antagonist
VDLAMGTERMVSMTEPGPPDLPDSRIDVESRAGVWLLSLHGEHDIATQPSLREQLGHVRAAGGPIVVDLSGASFVDSTIVGALLECAEGGSAVSAVAPPESAARRLADLVRMADALPVYDDLAAGIDAARMSPGVD